MGAKWVRVVALLGCRLACPLVAGGQAFGAILLMLAKLDRIPPDAQPFCPLSCIALCRVACRYGSISRFKGVFSAVWGFRVGLCCLRVLCGFCTRVELGG